MRPPALKSIDGAAGKPKRFLWSRLKGIGAVAQSMRRTGQGTFDLEPFGDFGYTLLMAHGPGEALRHVEGNTSIDLLFSDLIMPGGMDGNMLARAARDRRPKIKVLLTTGYAEASLERTDAGGSEFEVIMKPYRRMDLARRIRRVIDGPTGVG